MGMFKRMPDHLLKASTTCNEMKNEIYPLQKGCAKDIISPVGCNSHVSTTCSCASKAGMVGATSVASSAYHFIDRERLFEASVYPFCVDFIHLMRGSTMRSKMSGERESPWNVPRKI